MNEKTNIPIAKVVLFFNEFEELEKVLEEVPEEGVRLELTLDRLKELLGHGFGVTYDGEHTICINEEKPYFTPGNLKDILTRIMPIAQSLSPKFENLSSRYIEVDQRLDYVAVVDEDKEGHTDLEELSNW